MYTARRIAPKAPRCNPDSIHGSEFMNGRTVFILGAGFSHAAGLPLMDGLRHEALAELRANGHGALTDQNEKCSLEELLVRLRQSTEQSATSAGRRLLDTCLGLLWKKHMTMDDLPEPYLRFARSASESLGIVSLNWDLVCELALYAADVKWGYSTGSGAQIIKPHGSINWTNHSVVPKQKWKGGNGFVQVDANHSISYRPSDPFQDPLFGCSDDGFEYVTFPGLLHDNPQAVDRLWADARRRIDEASTVVFVGYSLPCYDTRARAEFHATCSGKSIAVIDPCEQVLKTYQDVFGSSISAHLSKFEDCSL